MAETYGSGDFQYTFEEGWAKLPSGMTFKECPGVAVDSRDQIHVLTRGDHPVIVFDRDGNFIRTYGEGLFSATTHEIFITHDDLVLIADIVLHTIQMFNLEGDKLMELGQRNQPAPAWSDQPFNRPTSAAIMPSSGDIYVSDGYGNSRVHVFTGSGDYKFSWGEAGIDAGQFMTPHNIAIDSDDKVYVVDREAHRIQIFDARGRFINMWNNIHRPDAMVLWQDHIYVGELNGMGGPGGRPGMGHRVTIYDLNGNRVCIFGATEEGEGAGKFIAPHGIAVDSKGDMYVGEVSWTNRGRNMDPPRELQSLTKYVRQW